MLPTAVLVPFCAAGFIVVGLVEHLFANVAVVAQVGSLAKHAVQCTVRAFIC
jgi:hypothetical protein